MAGDLDDDRPACFRGVLQGCGRVPHCPLEPARLPSRITEGLRRHLPGHSRMADSGFRVAWRIRRTPQWSAVLFLSMRRRRAIGVRLSSLVFANSEHDADTVANTATDHSTGCRDFSLVIMNGQLANYSSVWPRVASRHLARINGFPQRPSRAVTPPRGRRHRYDDRAMQDVSAYWLARNATIFSRYSGGSDARARS